MALIDASGSYIADSYSREGGAKALVPLEALETTPGALAVEVANTTALEALQPHFSTLKLIAIAFPGYMDGRGFTLAKRVRNAGYNGALRAVGPLIAEQFAYGLACGFTEFEIPDLYVPRMPEAVFKTAARAFSATYQRGYEGRGASILDARRAARQEGKNA